MAWLFGRALLSDEAFVFRDAAHYYYPLYKFVAGQWGEGRVPLWNPQENLGQPLLADATAAVLYPGKLVFALPLSFNTNYKLYIIGHLILAAATSYIAARGFARSVAAATLCALSFAFSGSVLFQYCNVIFLVSAAWLPLAVLSIDRMLTRRSWKWAGALAITLTMMILGGDPQMAYHAALIAVLYTLVQSRPRVLSRLGGQKNEAATEGDDFASQSGEHIPRPPGTGGLLFSRPVLIAGALLFTFLLSAAQILPSAAWSRGSTRAAYDSPRNVYELASTFGETADAKDRYGFLLGRTTDGHHAESYQYSVGPWHVADFLWPNCFGRVFPQNTRWIRALPAEGRTWTPTLYMGLLPLLLALSQLNFFGRATKFGRARLLPSQVRAMARREPRPPNEPRPPTLDNRRRTWLSWVVLLALLASMGWYSLGWLIAEVYHATTGGDANALPIGSPFGGVYWLMQTLLPGYAYFRYPAKWLVVAALGLSLLAAFGWDKLGGSAQRFVLRGLAIVCAISITLLAVACIDIFATSFWNALAEVTNKDALFGPLDTDLAGWELLGGLLHTVIVAALLYLLVRASCQTRGALWLLLILTAVDIAVTQGSLIPTTPAATIEDDSSLVVEMRQMKGEEEESAIRTHRRFWLPDEWAETSSPDRQTTGARFDRATLFPKYHLLEDVEMVQSASAVESLDHREFMRVVLREKMLPTIGTQFVIGPAGKSGLTTQVQKLPAGPQAWIVHDVDVLPPLDTHHPAAVRRRTREVLLDGGPRDLSVVAVVETDQPLPLDSAAATPRHDIERCEITRDTPDGVELNVKLSRAGLVVLADTYTADWRCEVTNLESGERRPVEVLRTNRVMRGVCLPAGEYRLAFRYRPVGFSVGLLVTLSAWVAMLIVAALEGLRRRGIARRQGNER